MQAGELGEREYMHDAIGEQALTYCGTGLKASKGFILAMPLFLDQSDNHDQSPAAQDHTSPLQNTRF
jgi:hypothetical protein